MYTKYNLTYIMEASEMYIGQRVLETNTVEDAMSLKLIELIGITESPFNEFYYEVTVAPLRFKHNMYLNNFNLN